jgi:hypothetical protein
MEDERQAIVNMIIRQGNKLEEIYTLTVSSAPNQGMGLERYKRWRELTEKLITENIGRDEANKFKRIKQAGRLMPAIQKFDYEVAKLRDFLVVLAEGVLDGSIELNPVALQSKRYHVLRKLYEMAPNDKHGDIEVGKLAQALGMQYHEANRILLYWQDKGMVRSPSDESVALTPYAIDEIETTIQFPDRPTEHFSTQVINYTDNRITIHGDNIGQAQAGNNAVQYININQGISEILPKLTDLINAVKQADFPDKEDVVRDLEKAHELALANPDITPKEGIWKRIQGKLDVAKTTMEIAGYAYTSLPYWPVIWKFFFG